MNKGHTSRSTPGKQQPDPRPSHGRQPARDSVPNRPRVHTPTKGIERKHTSGGSGGKPPKPPR